MLRRLQQRRRPSEGACHTLWVPAIHCSTWQVAHNAAQSKLLCKDALLRAVSERSLAQLAHRQKVGLPTAAAAPASLSRTCPFPAYALSRLALGPLTQPTILRQA